MSEKPTLLSEVHGRESLRALDRENRAVSENDIEIDRREAAGYDVVALLRKQEGNKLFLMVDFKDGAPMPIPALELPARSEHVPNPVKDALDHPFAYYAAAGIATEAFFAKSTEVEAA